MDAVKFLQERNRMYESGAATPSIGLEDVYNPVNAVKIVEDWSSAHPRKTRQSVFLEQWPRAQSDSGVLFCPKTIDTAYPCRCAIRSCGDCRRGFWSQEVE